MSGKQKQTHGECHVIRVKPIYYWKVITEEEIESKIEIIHKGVI